MYQIVLYFTLTLLILLSFTICYYYLLLPILIYECEIWSGKVVELNKVKVCLNKSVKRIFNMRQNEPVKYILMSFNMLPANFLALQKKLMLSANLMSSVNNIENCCGMRWTESDKWVRVNSMFNLI